LITVLSFISTYTIIFY